MSNGRNWTKKEDNLLRQYYSDNPTEIVAILLNRTLFGVYGRANNLGLKKSETFATSPLSGRNPKLGEMPSSIIHRFKKGHTPWNKGKKGICLGGQAGWFLKGHLPKNTKEDGVISIRKDSKGNFYKWIRITRAHWIPLHRHIWELSHGPIKRGFNIQFKDGDAMNCTLENLEIISKKQNMLRNTYHQWPEDLQQLLHTKAILTRQINKHSQL